MSDTLKALDKAWEEAFDAYHATVRAGNANPDLSWRYYVLGQLRSAYHLYADLDTLEETKP